MYEDFYLRAPTQEAFDAVFKSDDWPGVFADPIGTIYRADGSSEAGYHVNIRSSVGLPDTLLPFQIPEPQFPKRVWA